MTNPALLELRELVTLRARARDLPLSAQARSRSVQAGGVRSSFKGRGLEFDQVRAYQPTDDSRMIDWRVTARRGRPYTKQFCEERERPLLVLVDLHPGMRFGTRQHFKSVLAGKLTALLAWAASAAGDRVGGVVQGAGGHRELRPMAREQGVLSLLKAVTTLQPRDMAAMEPGRMDKALGRLAQIARPGSLVLVISDFREAGEAAPRHLRAIAQHNDLAGLFVSDPLEAEPPKGGTLTFSQGPGVQGAAGRELTLDAGQPGTAAAWRQRFATHRDSVFGLFRRHGGHCSEISTADEPVRALRRALAARVHGHAPGPQTREGAVRD